MSHYRIGDVNSQRDALNAPEKDKLKGIDSSRADLKDPNARLVEAI